MPNYKELALNGKYPSCYKPYLPFYQICVKGSQIIGKPVVSSAQLYKYQQCEFCIRKYKFAINLDTKE